VYESPTQNPLSPTEDAFLLFFPRRPLLAATAPRRLPPTPYRTVSPWGPRPPPPRSPPAAPRSSASSSACATRPASLHAPPAPLPADELAMEDGAAMARQSGPRAACGQRSGCGGANRPRRGGAAMARLRQSGCGEAERPWRRWLRPVPSSSALSRRGGVAMARRGGAAMAAVAPLSSTVVALPPLSTVGGGVDPLHPRPLPRAPPSRRAPAAFLRRGAECRRRLPSFVLGERNTREECVEEREGRIFASCLARYPKWVSRLDSRLEKDFGWQRHCA
jgi:hypothetical protein